MKHYRPSSELQRSAEQALRNRRRLTIWRKRYWQQLATQEPAAPAQSSTADVATNTES